MRITYPCIFCIPIDIATDGLLCYRLYNIFDIIVNRYTRYSFFHKKNHDVIHKEFCIFMHIIMDLCIKKVKETRIFLEWGDIEKQTKCIIFLEGAGFKKISTEIRE